MTGTAARAVVGAALAVLAPLVGVVLYVQSPAHSLHDPDHALQQLDLLYLDQPAPGARKLGLVPGQVSVVVFCHRADCPLPALVAAQVVRSTDDDLAAQYGLAQGSRTGYALVDAAGRVRYRSEDPRVDRHARELQTLVDAVAAP